MARDGWPECPVIYEIDPRSVRETSGSGTGRLRGIVERMDDVAGLGVDAIWIAPFFASPMEDGCYDITEHRQVDLRFGTMEDVEAVLRPRARQPG